MATVQTARALPAGPERIFAESPFVATRMDTGMPTMAPTTTQAKITDNTTRAIWRATARLDDSDFCPNGFASCAANGFSFSTFMDRLLIEYRCPISNINTETMGSQEKFI